MTNTTNTNINLILSKLNELVENTNKRFDSLESRMTRIELDMTEQFYKLSNNMNRIELDMTKQFYKLSNNIKTLMNTNNNRSDIQELEMSDLLYNTLKNLYDNLTRKGFQYKIVKVNDLKIIYNKDNNQLTDLDGVLIVEIANNVHNVNAHNESIKKIQNMLNEYDLNDNVKKTFTKNIENSKTKIDYIHSNSKLYVLESKNHFLKPDIDKKIDQMIKLKDIIINSKTINLSTLKKQGNYYKMIKTMQKYTVLPSDINLYIATDHITSNTIDYLKSIFNSFDQKAYDKHTYLTLNEYKGWHKFITKLKDEARNDITIKSCISKYTSTTSLDNIRNLLTDIEVTYMNKLAINEDKDQLPENKEELLERYHIDEMLKDIVFYKSWVTSYNDLVFKDNIFKHKIGLIYMNQNVPLDGTSKLLISRSENTNVLPYNFGDTDSLYNLENNV